MSLLSGPPLKGKLVFWALPVAMVVLCAFVVSMNMFHLSSCPNETDTAKEKTLKVAALGKRLSSLEQELVQNSLLLEEVLRGLDRRLQLLKVHHELPNHQKQAHDAAAKVMVRMRLGNPPPIPDSISLNLLQKPPHDLNGLAKEIEDAFHWKNRNFYDDFEDAWASKSNPDKKHVVHVGKWIPENVSDELDAFDEIDALLDADDYAEEAKEKDTRTSKQVEEECVSLKLKYNVIPDIDWGNLPKPLQQRWKKDDCNIWVAIHDYGKAAKAQRD